MASNKSVVVSTPNGRRQTVKVTPNTTILQILEEVCNKQGFKPNEYDLKHHKHVLDTTAIIRFSGLPNNAQLEMCSAQRVRTESSVTLGLQLENGNRLTGDFTPSDNLWDVVEMLCPEENSSTANVVVIYMRNEVYGEALKKTDLRSLGLTGGRAMLRLVHKTPQELKRQANVSSLLPMKPVEEKPYIRKPKQVDFNVNNSPTIESSSNDASAPQGSLHDNKCNIVDFLKKEKNKYVKNEKHSASCNDVAMEVEEVQNVTSRRRNSEKDTESRNKVKLKEDPRTIDDFIFLGERYAMAFSMEMSQSLPHEELPDEFFELTIQDARRIFHDLKSKREELEESPLQTNELRKLEQSKKVLRQINQYKKSVIRVQFPDRTVLQGSFKPLELVQHVQDFVREYLEDPSCDFYLYTSPPKTLLDPSETLVDSGCVPSALVYFGGCDRLPENNSILRANLFSRFVTPSTASIAASKLIFTNKRESVEESDPVATEVNAGASTSKEPPPDTRDEPRTKVPKWFKPAN